MGAPIGGNNLQPHEPSTRDQKSQTIRKDIDTLVRDLVPKGEVVVHIDVCVTTRVGSELEGVLFRRYSMPGPDPLCSIVMLDVLKKRLGKQLRRRPRPKNGA